MEILLPSEYLYLHGKKNRFNYIAQQSQGPLHSDYISGEWADPSQRRNARLPFRR